MLLFVNKGYYIINNVNYNLNDNIILTPNSAGNYNVYIQYIGEDGYADATISISYRVNEGQYDYYASSLLGDNNNAGVSPYAPVQDIETLLSISGVNDRLCLMEGEYNHDTLLRNAKFYGYNKHRIENIELNINRIGPNIELSLKNLSVNTGDGYVNIADMHTFFNNSDEYVILKAIPGEHDEPVWFEDVYEILMNDENDYKLYIPSNVKTRMEFFKGYGVKELISTVIVFACLLPISLIIYKLQDNFLLPVVIEFIGVADKPTTFALE